MLYTTLNGMGLLKPSNQLHVPAISKAQYQGATNADSAFIVRISMEKADEGFILSGESSLSTGALVTVSLKNASCESATTLLEFSQLIEVSSTGCSVME